MKINTVKKVITAVLLLAVLLGFVCKNLFVSADSISEICEDFRDIQSKEDLVAWIQNSESEINDELLYHDYLIDLNSVIQKGLGKQVTNDYELIRGEDGMLYYGSVYDNPNHDVGEMTEQVVKLKELTDSRNEKLIVMLPPSKILYGLSNVDLSLPLNDPNPRMDKFLSQLQQRRVTALDLRLTMQRSGEPVSELFYKTDHHWTPKAAFYAMQDLVQLLRDKYGQDLDPDGYYCDLNNYTVDSYPESMLGTHGKKTGRYYSGLDDFNLMYLTDYEDTDFSWDNHDDEKKRGNIKESLLHMKNLEFDNYYKQDLYSVYIDAVSDRDSIVNKNNRDGVKIAVLRDSYFSPTAVFLAPMCGTIDMFWNQDDGAEEAFLKAIQEESYDYVILEVYPYNLNTETFHFFGEN